jgi:hypothetical protein
VALLGAALVMSAASPSSADEDAMTEAAMRFQKGVELFEEGENEAALAEFHWAYSLKPHFAVLYNIAQCYYAIGRHDKALEYFSRYLDEGTGQIPGKRVDEVEQAIAHLLELMAEVAVSSIPEGAKVLVDGKVLGTTPFGKPVHVPAGPHTIEVALTGYLPVQEDVILTGGQSLTKIVKLKEDKREGILTVTATAPKAIVWIDGREMGPAPWSGPLAVGEHTVVVKAPGHHDATRPVVVMPDEQRAINVEMAIKGTPGKLGIETNVQGAQIFIDGADRGQTPLTGIMLPVGIYKVSVVKKGHAEWEGDVTIKEGIPTSLTVELQSSEGKIGPAGFWIATSLTLAGLATGSVFGIMALSKQKELTDKYNKLKDEGRKHSLVADVCWGLSGAAAVTAIFLAFFTRFKPAQSTARIDFGPIATGGGMLTLTTSWSM